MYLSVGFGLKEQGLALSLSHPDPPVHLSILFAHVSVCPCACRSVCQCINLPVCPYVRVCISPRPPVRPGMHMWVHVRSHTCMPTHIHGSACLPKSSGDVEPDPSRAIITCMCMCVHAHMRVRVCMRTYPCVCACVRVCICACVPGSLCTDQQTRTRKHTCGSRTSPGKA